MTSMVVCPEPLAARTGEEVLRAGGNAVDAAIATSFAQGITNPLACGIGGMALMHVFQTHSLSSTVLHGSASIGSRPPPDRLISGYVGRSETLGRHLVQDDINQYGHLSVLVPG